MTPIHALLTVLAVLGPLVHALPTTPYPSSDNAPVIVPLSDPVSVLRREFHARAPIILMDPELDNDSAKFSQASKSTKVAEPKSKSKSKSKVVRQIMPMPLMLANRRAIQTREEPYVNYVSDVGFPPSSPSSSTTSAAAVETPSPKAKSEKSKDKDANGEDKDAKGKDKETSDKGKDTSEKGKDTKEKGKGKKEKGEDDKKATSA